MVAQWQHVKPPHSDSSLIGNARYVSAIYHHQPHCLPTSCRRYIIKFNFSFLQQYHAALQLINIMIEIHNAD